MVIVGRSFNAIKQELTGLLRLALCWLGAYALTWICSYLANGKARLILTLFFYRHTVHHFYVPTVIVVKVAIIARQVKRRCSTIKAAI